MPPDTIFIRRTLRDINSACNSLYEQIRKDVPYRKKGVFPDTIVGLTRGGWVPARFLCDRFSYYMLGKDKDGKYSIKVQYPNLLCYGIRRYGAFDIKESDDKDKGPRPFQRPTEVQNDDLADKYVLVVDDVFDAGASLARVLRDLHKTFRPAGLYVAVLDFKEAPFDLDPVKRVEKEKERRTSMAVIDSIAKKFYYAKKIPQNSWTIYPWEAKEQPMEVFNSFGDKEFKNLDFHGEIPLRYIEEQLSEHGRLLNEKEKREAREKKR